MPDVPAQREPTAVIHDLNNALMTVLANTEFVASASRVPQVRLDAEEAFLAAQQAVRLVRELALVLRDRP